jgi:hypothetical protein
MRSRLQQNIKKQNTKTIAAILVIIVLLAIFGTQLLIGFGVILNAIRGNDDSKIESQTVDYIAPPILDTLPDATNKDRIDITGSVIDDNVMVSLRINNEFLTETKPRADKTFVFRSVLLKKGVNEIKTQVITNDDKSSGFSESVKVKYLDKEPNLEIKEPTDGQIFKKDQSPIRISGLTDPSAKVTVNDFWAITSDDGEFYYMYTLKDGGNNLKVTSTDQAGNKTTKEIIINVE